MSIKAVPISRLIIIICVTFHLCCKILLPSFPGLYPPTIQGPSTLTVTYQQTYSFQIIAYSNISALLNYTIEVNGTTLSVDPNTGNVTWFVNSTDFRLRYVVTDSNNNSAALSPTVTLCNCRNGGTCNPAVANPLFETTNNLLTYGECTCRSGFTGAFCEDQVSYCLQEPCFEGVNCTDNFTSGSADCGPCPSGYIGDGRKCFGIAYFLSTYSPSALLSQLNRKLLWPKFKRRWLYAPFYYILLLLRNTGRLRFKSRLENALLQRKF